MRITICLSVFSQSVSVSVCFRMFVVSFDSTTLPYRLPSSFPARHFRNTPKTGGSLQVEGAASMVERLPQDFSLKFFVASSKWVEQMSRVSGSRVPYQ